MAYREEDLTYPGSLELTQCSLCFVFPFKPIYNVTCTKSNQTRSLMTFSSCSQPDAQLIGRGYTYPRIDDHLGPREGKGMDAVGDALPCAMESDYTSLPGFSFNLIKILNFMSISFYIGKTVLSLAIWRISMAS